MKKIIALFMAFGILSACTIIDSEGDVNFEQNHVADRDISLATPSVSESIRRP